ncbi:MAG: 4Fe-4S cluster-binding domain-containing protein [Eubacterium sp.]|nr:4Fe-4S cluster-binding domain-containing protein [Eubacterium sp.]
MICSICPRECKADRENGIGYCGCGDCFKLARASLHYWEEPCISGTLGSGAVFFSGCNLRCAYCQNFEISHQCKGVEITDDRLIEIFENLVEQGAQNINLVNPTHYAHRLASVLSKWKSPVPIVYNSSGYESVDMLKNLEGIIDIYLPDLKYIRADKSKKYSKAENYFEIASKALLEMRRQVSDSFGKDGMMKSGMIVRHLILPQNTNSSLEIIDWITDNLPDTYVSLMAQYVPCGDLSDCTELNRKITKREYGKVVDYALNRGMDKLFIQELTSADKKFIPQFDFFGII